MPGVDGMEADEELQYDPSTYDCLHALQLEWPCLSVDPLRDARGERRAALPHDLVAVAGSQADVAANNRLTVFKLSNVASTRRRAEGDADEDDSEEESSDDDTDDEMAEASGAGGGRGNAKAPRLSARAVPHAGGVNRVRAMPQMSGIVAAWGDTGYVLCMCMCMRACVHVYAGVHVCACVSALCGRAGPAQAQPSTACTNYC